MRTPIEQEQHSTAERWTVSYADFMTLLFALFVVLFASSRHETKDIQQVSTAVRGGFQQLALSPKEASPGTSTTALPVTISHSAGIDVAALQHDLTATLGKEIARNEVVLRMTPDGFVISLRELGFFRSGEATMLPGAGSKIQRIGAVLTKYGLNMRVEGHTDDIPIHTRTYGSNWDLSTARATSVAMMLIEQAHFDPYRISIAGYGQFHPVSSNNTSLGRQQNRRVDIVIVTVTNPAAQAGK